MVFSSKGVLPNLFAVLGYTVFSLVVLAALLEFASWAIWSAYHTKHLEGPENQAASPVYAGTAWAQEFWQEEYSRRKSRKSYVPFLLWDVTDWHGKYINNDQGPTGVWRRTLNPAEDQCKLKHRLTVWIFGGSTVLWNRCAGLGNVAIVFVARLERRQFGLRNGFKFRGGGLCK